MKSGQTTIRLLAVLAAVALAQGCGDGNSPTAAPTPEPARPTTVTVSPATAELTALGATVQLTAEVRDQHARVMAGTTVTWSSGDASVAKVAASGLVVAVANGTASIMATSVAASGIATVTVTQEVSAVVVTSPAGDTVAVGDTLRVLAEASDLNGHGVAGAEFSWQSSDTTIAKVDATGLVTGIGVGSVELAATSAGVTGRTLLAVQGFELGGVVKDSRTDLVIAGATVRIDGGPHSGETSNTGIDGRYRFDNLAGVVNLTAQAAGYVDGTVQVALDADRTVDFELEPTGVPPYSGTVFISPRIIEPSDPTTLERITYVGRGQRLIYDRRPDMWVTVDAYLFDVRYAGQDVEFRVNPEFGDSVAAQAEVETYAPALGQMPTVLRSAITHVVVNAGHELWGGGGDGILIHTGTGKDYIRDGFMEEILVHEAAHSALDTAHRHSPGWRAAQTADGIFISVYARDHPDREDIAESFLPYLAVRYRPARLTSVDRETIATTIPNRLAYFDEQTFDMSPLVVATTSKASVAHSESVALGQTAPRTGAGHDGSCPTIGHSWTLSAAKRQPTRTTRPVPTGSVPGSDARWSKSRGPSSPAAAGAGPS